MHGTKGKSIRTAYILWMLGGLGWLGLHRLYLKKKKTAILWLFTFGFFGLGTVADLFALPWLVKRYNLIQEIKVLNHMMSMLKSQKETYVQLQRFEEAASIRDREKLAIETKERLIKALRATDIT